MIKLWKFQILKSRYTVISVLWKKRYKINTKNEIWACNKKYKVKREMKFVIIFHILFFPTRTKWYIWWWLCSFSFPSYLFRFIYFFYFCFVWNVEKGRTEKEREKNTQMCWGWRRQQHHHHHRQQQYQNEDRIHNHKELMEHFCSHAHTYLYCRNGKT